MFKPITPAQIAKVKNLLSQGYSIRSAAQSSDMSFISARKIYNQIPVGVGFPKRKEKSGSQGEYFNVNERCWITGINISNERR